MVIVGVTVGLIALVCDMLLRSLAWGGSGSPQQQQRQEGRRRRLADHPADRRRDPRADRGQGGADGGVAPARVPCRRDVGAVHPQPQRADLGAAASSPRGAAPFPGVSRATQHLFIVNPVQTFTGQMLGAPGHASRRCRSHRSPAQSGRLACRPPRPSTCRAIAAHGACAGEHAGRLPHALDARRHHARDRSRDHQGRRPGASATSRGSIPTWSAGRTASGSPQPARRSIRSRSPSFDATTSAGINPASRYGQQFPEQKPADGERFPTLAEFFALGGPDVRFNIEIKTDPTKPDLDARSRALRADWSSRRSGREDWSGAAPIQSFDWRGLIAVAPAGAGDRHRAASSIESNNIDTVGRPRTAVALARRARPQGPWRLGAAARQGGGLRRLVAVLAQRHGREREGSPGTWPESRSLDREQSGRHGPADRSGSRRPDHRLSGPRPCRFSPTKGLKSR